MMPRPSLHLLTEHRPRRHRGRRRRAALGLRGAVAVLPSARSRTDATDPYPATAEVDSTRGVDAAGELAAAAIAAPPALAPLAEPLRLDIAAQRVREAGGPRDEASYNCTCGCLFAAAVSTSVECPHCGASQAW